MQCFDKVRGVQEHGNELHACMYGAGTAQREGLGRGGGGLSPPPFFARIKIN